MDDHIINLLNGFGNGIKDDVFLDEDGVPTDRFLQALKTDYGPSVNRDARKSPPRTTSAPSSSSIARSKVAAAALRPPLPPQPVQQNVKGHDYLMIRRSDYHPSPLLDQAYAQEQQEEYQVAQDEGKYGMDDVYEMDCFDGAWVEPPQARYPPPPNSSKSKRKPPPKKKTAPVSKPKSTFTTTRSTRHNSPAPAEPDVEEKLADAAIFPSIDADLDLDGLAAETRARTLRLRLQGQQNAIRALEAQLAEALECLETKSAQLAVATSKLAVLQPQAQELRRKAVVATMEGQKTVVLKKDELLEKYRSQIELLQARLAEEKQHRSKDQDRFKSMKDYNERAKIRTREMEARCAELTATLAECHSKLLKFRKDSKDLSADVQGNYCSHRPLQLLALQ